MAQVLQVPVVTPIKTIAQRNGVSVDAVRKRAKRQGFALQTVYLNSRTQVGVTEREARILDDSFDTRFPVPICDIALEHHVTVKSVRDKVRRRQMAFGIRMIDGRSKVCVSRADAEELHQSFANTTHEDIGWYTLDEAWRMVGSSSKHAFLDQIRRGVLQIRTKRLSGASGRRTRYNPQDVRREASKTPIRPATVPSGSLGTAEMTEVTGISKSNLYIWGRAGMPHELLKTGHRYWPLVRVINWLEGYPDHPKRQEAKVRLQRHLEK